MQRDQLLRERLMLVCDGARKASVDADIAALRPSKLVEPLPERREPRLQVRIVLGAAEQHADAPHVTVLRTRGAWPGQRNRGRASEAGQDLTSQDLTSSDSEHTTLPVVRIYIRRWQPSMPNSRFV